jgi:hypothetical protein
MNDVVGLEQFSGASNETNPPSDPKARFTVRSDLSDRLSEGETIQFAGWMAETYRRIKTCEFDEMRAKYQLGDVTPEANSAYLQHNDKSMRDDQCREEFKSWASKTLFREEANRYRQLRASSFRVAQEREIFASDRLSRQEHKFKHRRLNPYYQVQRVGQAGQAGQAYKSPYGEKVWGSETRDKYG